MNRLWGEASKASAVTYVSYLIALLAVVFDVGYFGALDINLFTAFSLSEHLLFAIEAIPTAIAIVATIFLVYVVVGSNTEHSASNAKNFNLTRFRIGRYVWLSITLGAVFVLLFSVFQIGVERIFIFYTGACIAVSAVVTIECKIRRFDFFEYLFVMAIFSILFSFFLGYITAGVYVDPSRRSLCSQELKLKNEELHRVKLIRMGERGVMYFDVDIKKVQFRRWDDVTSIATVPHFGSAACT
jgi:hypothetical protein